MIKYNPQKIERKWQKRWEHEHLFEAKENSKKKKFYVLDMFPYPSSAGLHVGHPEGYTATDIIARKKWLEGWNVLHPMGWDAFGLPAENFAIKTGRHPALTTAAAIKTFRRQIKSLGLAYDWSREVNTSSPEYYKWTQWLFLLLYKNGLAYRKKAPVNWCPSCQTVLAREQVVDGNCERCKNQVVQKDLEQWFFRITEYADRLLADLDKIDWPEKIKDMQRNWIGRSEGVIINFKGIRKELRSKKQEVGEKEYSIPVFTTRPDTIFGVTYLVLAPEHPLVQELVIDGEREAVAKYISETFKKTELERTGLEKDPSTGLRAGKTGVPLGASAVNPLTGEKVPIWIADYVLYGYGTGVVMGVPAHDKRDFDFAGKYGLDVKYVIAPPHEVSEAKHEEIHHSPPQSSPLKRGYPHLNPPPASRGRMEGVGAYTEEGYLVNSNEFSGLTSSDGRQKIASFIESKGVGSRQTNYHLRDWLVSRQRYWGAPIPIVYCRNCARAQTSMHSAALTQSQSEGRRFGLENSKSFDIAMIDGVEYAIVPVPENDLPVKLPKDVDFRPTGQSPLARSKSFHKVKCPRCGSPAHRESDTMDTFVDSSWYYLRYCNPRSEPEAQIGSEAPKALRAQQAALQARGKVGLVSKDFLDSQKISYWCPVDLYVGGAEHAVMHLLYARFFAKILYDLKFISFDEPFLKLRNQGLIMGEDGQKMSKSRGNVINPDDVVKEHSADTLRLYEMFMGDFAESKPWSTSSIKGVRRFLDRVWQLQAHITPTLILPLKKGEEVRRKAEQGGGHDQDLERLLHKTIKKVTEDIENFKFNTAISAMMILTNAMYDYVTELRAVSSSSSVIARPKAEAIFSKNISQSWYEQLILLLSPFAPHISEEIWANLGHKNFIIKELWPVYDQALTKDDEINLVVQVNGRVRDTICVSVDISEEEARLVALGSLNIKKYLEGKKVQKVIFVPRKLINFVI